MSCVESRAGRIYIGDKDVTDLGKFDEKTGLHTMKYADGGFAMWSSDGLEVFSFAKGTPQSMIDWALSMRKTKSNGDYIQCAL